MIMSNDLEIMWKEVYVAYFKTGPIFPLERRITRYGSQDGRNLRNKYQEL